jgi:hypothetical protein
MWWNESGDGNNRRQPDLKQALLTDDDFCVFSLPCWLCFGFAAERLPNIAYPAAA